VYDYLGSRVRKTADGIESIYLYNDEDIVKEITGGVDTNYFHGVGIDEPVMMDRSGAKYYYFRDGLGSIREMIDCGGTVQNSYNYGAWGEVRNQSAVVLNTYGYTGREFSEDGLYFYRARYLNASLGRFISEDPIGFYGGINFYRYVDNDPINLIDPSGKKCIVIFKFPYFRNKKDKDYIGDAYWASEGWNEPQLSINPCLPTPPEYVVHCLYALYRDYKYTITRERGYTVTYLCCDRCSGCDFITDVVITSRTTKRKYDREFIESASRTLTLLYPLATKIMQECLKLIPK